MPRSSNSRGVIAAALITAAATILAALIANYTGKSDDDSNRSPTAETRSVEAHRPLAGSLQPTPPGSSNRQAPTPVTPWFALPGAGPAAIALAVTAPPGFPLDIARALADQLSTPDRVVVIADVEHHKELIRRLIGGDGNALAGQPLRDRSLLLVAQASADTSASGLSPDLVTCSLTVDFTLFTLDGHQKESGRIADSGAGFRAADAAARAVDRVGDKLSARLVAQGH